MTIDAHPSVLRSFRETQGMPEGCEDGLVAGTTVGDVRYNSVGSDVV